ncbi:hypothetical protein ACG7TL_004955 [Trametes sanguinea]
MATLRPPTPTPALPQRRPHPPSIPASTTSVYSVAQAVKTAHYVFVRRPEFDPLCQNAATDHQGAS